MNWTRVIALTLLAVAGPAQAKDIVISVDARCAPWRTGVNPKMAFGLPNAKPPAVLMNPLLRPGRSVHITATGTTTTYGPESFGPNGVPEWTKDVGGALLPSHYMSKKDGAVHLNELVGAFIDADGKVVGKPFPIGAKAQLVVPDGAAALSMGLNDDNFSDNTGVLMVTIQISEPSVTVEPSADPGQR